MSHQEHRRAAPATLRCALLTISDSRTPETDESGRRMREILERAGHTIAAQRIIPDERALIACCVQAWIADPGIDVILTTGGTGLSRRDVTCEAVEPLLEKRIDGIGEIFRAQGYQEIGAAALLSRTLGGVARGTVVCLLPGSPEAVTLALHRIILPELGHMVREARR